MLQPFQTQNRSRILTAAAIASCLGLYLGLAVWTQIKINPFVRSDIDIFLDAGQKASLGINPYQPVEIGSSFIYPPTALLIFSPLSALTAGVSKFVWGMLNILALATVLFVLSRLLPVHSNRRLAGWVSLALLAFTPALETLMTGQVNHFVLLGIVVFALGLVQPKYRIIGDFGLAIAIAIKISPLLLVALPVVQRDWRRCVRIGLCLTALSAVSIIAYRLSVWNSFLQVLPLLFNGYPSPINQTLPPSLHRLFELGSYNINVTWLGSLFTITVLCVWLGALISRRQNHQLGRVTLGIVTMTIGSSLIWFHHLTFLIVPIVYLLATARASSGVPRLVITSVFLIQGDRFFEAITSLPLPSILGYLLLYTVAVYASLQPAAAQQ